MKRDIEWIDKLGDDLKRTARVKFPGNGKVKWQFKRSDEEVWDYNATPTDEDWATLEDKMEALYNRRRAPYKDLQLVHQLRKEASST